MFFSRGRSLKPSSSVNANPTRLAPVGVGVVGRDLGVGAVPQQALDHRCDLG
jgi:hypothetical protein